MLLIVLMVGLMIGWGVTKTALDVIIPEFNSIGEVAPGINVSESTTMVSNPITSIVDNFGLIIGLIYVLGVGGLLSYSFVFRNNLNGWAIAFFFIMIIVLIFLCILISQSYEEFYLAQDDLGTTLRSAGLASFLIIYSPNIMMIIAVICGIILFSGNREDSYYV